MKHSVMVRAGDTMSARAKTKTEGRARVHDRGHAYTRRCVYMHPCMCAWVCLYVHIWKEVWSV